MRLCSVFAAAVMITLTAFSQSGSINNTIGSSGSFTVKDGSTTFLSVAGLTGEVHIANYLSFPETVDNSTGVIYISGLAFLHDFHASGTDGYNTFVGQRAGNFTMGSVNYSEASNNTGVGYWALGGLTTGYENAAFGSTALWFTTTGFRNAAFGSSSMGLNTTGYDNAALGYNSLGTNSSGSENTAAGAMALYENTTGSYNSAFGSQSLHACTAGTNNAAFGYNALGNVNGSYNSAFGSLALTTSYSTAQYNSAFGYQSLTSNTTGTSNSAFGSQSLYSATTSSGNTAIGSSSLHSATDGYSNTAVGVSALYGNTTGDYNTALGYLSGGNITTGNYNATVGYLAGSGISTGSNNICIGYSAQVPTGTDSNQVRIGNPFITYAGIQVAWSITSDRRWKSNINQSDLGLEFVSRLNPVSYTRKNDTRRRSEYGFIAQEVEEVLKQAGVRNSGMVTVDDEGRYELRYNDLMAPIVKAIQELKVQNDALRAENNLMRERLSALERKSSVEPKGVNSSHSFSER